MAGRFKAATVDEIETVLRLWREHGTVGPVSRDAHISVTRVRRILEEAGMAASRSVGLGRLPTDTEWAYIAGAFDFRGGLVASGPGDIVQISSSHPSTANRIKELVGAGNVNVKPNGRARFRLSNRSQIVAFLRGVQPYVVGQRNRVAAALADLQDDQEDDQSTSLVHRQANEIAGMIW